MLADEYWEKSLGLVITALTILKFLSFKIKAGIFKSNPRFWIGLSVANILRMFDDIFKTTTNKQLKTNIDVRWKS